MDGRADDVVGKPAVALHANFADAELIDDDLDDTGGDILLRRDDINQRMVRCL